MTRPLPFRLGGYGTIVADPPWHFDDQAGRMALGYGTMRDDEILALPVDTLAPKYHDGHLYLWTLRCMARWGYVFKRSIVWVKTTQDPADMRRLTGLVRDVPSVILAPHPRDERGRIIHSAKPARLHEIAERLSPGLFARRARQGWDIWGDQAPTNKEA